MRSRVDKWLVAGGFALVVMQALILVTTPLQFASLVVATLLTCAGLLGLGRRLGRERRLYVQLRLEFDRFTRLVRELNTQTVAGEGRLASETQAAMHESVDRIASVAGVIQGEEGTTDQPRA